MNRFRCMIGFVLMKYRHDPLAKKKDTWLANNNDERTATIAMIGHFFSTPEWLTFPPFGFRISGPGLSRLRPLFSFPLGWHCLWFFFYHGFRFEASQWIDWVDFRGSKQGLGKKNFHHSITQDAILHVHVKLLWTTKALNLWRLSIFINLKLQKLSFKSSS